MHKGEPRARALNNFSWDKSSFSRMFKEAKTAKDFIEIWHKQVSPYLNVNTGEYNMPQDSANILSSSHQRKRARDLDSASSISTSMPQPTKKSKHDKPTDTDDSKIEECFSGQSLKLYAIVE